MNIMPSGGITIQIVPVYRNPRIRVAEEDVLDDEMDNIASSSQESILMERFIYLISTGQPRKSKDGVA